MRATGTVFLTVDRDGMVLVSYHEHTKAGRVRPCGQTFMRGNWRHVLSAISPQPDTRVVVHPACPACGGPKPLDQSCGCIDDTREL